MHKKTPSSLDYETLLHELALKNWRRTMLADDFSRALANAGSLARSRDRFWRWLGWLHAATTYLSLGQARNALEALDEAMDCFRDVPALQAPAREIAAHSLLASGKAREALDVAKSPGTGTPQLLYAGGLALARLSRRGEVESLGAELSRTGGAWGPALGAQLLFELSPRGESPEALERWQAAVAGVPLSNRSEAAGAAVLVLESLASALADLDRAVEALAILEEVLRLPEAHLHWPIPYARSLYRIGRLLHRGGERERAHPHLERFLLFWGDGELDRDRVEEARQLVKA